MLFNGISSQMTANRMYSNSASATKVSMERLGSGLKINTASDDPTNLSISNRYTAQIRSANQEIRNASDGISLIHVADGGLGEMQDILQRLRELAVQSANDSYNSEDRQDLQNEATQLVEELDNIAKNTQFNDQSVLNGLFDPDTIDPNENSVPASPPPPFGTGDPGSAGSPETGSVLKLSVGSSGEAVEITITNSRAASLLDEVEEVIAFSGGGGLPAREGVNAVDAGDVDISTRGNANASISQIDTAIDRIADVRTTLGSHENRLAGTIENLTSIMNNTVSTRSSVMDADIAKETSNLTKSTIMQQISVSIMAQANQQPSLVAQLLG